MENLYKPTNNVDEDLLSHEDICARAERLLLWADKTADNQPKDYKSTFIPEALPGDRKVSETPGTVQLLCSSI